MINKPLRQLQKQVFDVFTKLEKDREVMLKKADSLPHCLDKLILMSKANGLSDGIIGLGPVIELIQKQTDLENNEQQNPNKVEHE